MDDTQFELLLNAINKLTTAIEDVGKKISAKDITLTEAVTGVTDAIELL